MAFNRCNVCSGFIHHSFIARGVDVYRCTGEDAWNDAGRYFIQSGSSGLIQVLPRREGKTWTYIIVDEERERLKAEAKTIEEEMEKRRQLFIKAQLVVAAHYKRGDEVE